jgi:hypothetical protein
MPMEKKGNKISPKVSSYTQNIEEVKISSITYECLQFLVIDTMLFGHLYTLFS